MRDISASRSMPWEWRNSFAIFSLGEYWWSWEKRDDSVMGLAPVFFS